MLAEGQRLFVRVYSEEFVSQFKGAVPSGSLVETLALRHDPQVARFKEQLESWYAETGRDAQKLLLQPLRSRQDDEFYQAFFSLALQRFVARSGWRSVFRPYEEGAPTFRITAGNPPVEFDMEVAAVAPRAAGGKERKVQLLMAELSSIESHFVFAVHVRRWLPEDFDPAKVRAALEQWLSELSKDEQYASRRAQYLDDRIDIEFAILYKAEQHAANCIGLWLAPLDVEEHFEALNQSTEAALTKIRAAEASKRPYVVALCHGDTWGMVENTIMHALYGKPRSIRARSGFGGGRRKVYDYSKTFRKAIFNRPGNEVLSAVLFIEAHWHQGEIQYDMRVFHNPWAATPLSLDYFGILPQLVPAPMQATQSNQPQPLLSWRNQMKQLVSLGD